MNQNYYLNEQQIKAIANNLNKKINLPFLGERAEHGILSMAISKVLNVMEDTLPKEFIGFLTTTTEGFEPRSETALEGIKDNMVKYVNQKVNLPIIGERAEKRLFETLIDLLFDAMQKEKAIQV